MKVKETTDQFGWSLQKIDLKRVDLLDHGADHH